MSNEMLIGFIVSLVLGAAGIVFNTSIKQMIKQFFSKLTKKQIQMVFVGLFGLAVVFPSALVTFLFEDDNKEKIQVFNENHEAQKTETEVIVDAADKGVQLVDKLISQQKKKDSLKRANKETHWVYQIGVPKNSKKELWETYKLLQHIPNVTVFKESRRSYYIIKDDGVEKDSLINQESAFKVTIDKIENRIKIINLATFCKVRKEIKEGKRLKIRKPKVKLPCLICD